jgi:hypothetical protein
VPDFLVVAISHLPFNYLQFTILAFYLPLPSGNVTLAQQQPYLCATARLPLRSGK